MRDDSASDARPYVEVRALARGIALLTELNRIGEARAAALAKAAGIDRTTTYRLLATLERLGLVEQRASDDAYVLAAKVRSLSDGYGERDHLTRCVSLHLGSLFQDVLWPTDFATFERNAMVIRDTTHRFSPYSVHRNMVGRPRPLFSSALGRAFLAGASETQRAAVIDMARGTAPDVLGLASLSFLDETVERLLAEFATHGYSWSIGGTEAHVSAVAVPILGPDGARGAINLVFFRSAMTAEEAATRYLAPMRACVARIEADLMQDRFG